MLKTYVAKRYVSPEQFAKYQEVLQQTTGDGYSPETCVLAACVAANIEPPKWREPTEIVVQYG